MHVTRTAWSLTSSLRCPQLIPTPGHGRGSSQPVPLRAPAAWPLEPRLSCTFGHGSEPKPLSRACEPFTQPVIHGPEEHVTAGNPPGTRKPMLSWVSLSAQEPRSTPLLSCAAPSSRAPSGGGRGSGRGRGRRGAGARPGDLSLPSRPRPRELAGRPACRQVPGCGGVDLR